MLESSILLSPRRGVKVYNDDGPDPDIFNVGDEADDDLDVPCEHTAASSCQEQDPESSARPAAFRSGNAVATPELTHPGESASSVCAERAVQTIETYCSTLLASLQARIKIPVPCDHPLMGWLVHRSAYLLNRYQLGSDDRTAWGRLHDQKATERACEFG